MWQKTETLDEKYYVDYIITEDKTDQVLKIYSLLLFLLFIIIHSGQR